jgi:formate dehydrogenase maturation protein FdhE
MTQVVLREHSEIDVESLQLFCGVCDKRSAILRWDENYEGYRGRCSLCEYDWPES